MRVHLYLAAAFMSRVASLHVFMYLSIEAHSMTYSSAQSISGAGIPSGLSSFTVPWQKMEEASAECCIKNPLPLGDL